MSTRCVAPGSVIRATSFPTRAEPNFKQTPPLRVLYGPARRVRRYDACIVQGGAATTTATAKAAQVRGQDPVQPTPSDHHPSAHPAHPAQAALIRLPIWALKPALIADTDRPGTGVSKAPMKPRADETPRRLTRSARLAGHEVQTVLLSEERVGRLADLAGDVFGCDPLVIRYNNPARHVATPPSRTH